MSLRWYLPCSFDTRTVTLRNENEEVRQEPQRFAGPRHRVIPWHTINQEDPLQQGTTTLERIREAQEALASAQSAMDKAQTGLSGVESVAETAQKARQHPMTTTAIVLAVGLAAAFTVMGLRGTDEN